ncbi:CDP-glucose 4,6-dehydratase [Roseimaritima multifibrata]|uniref:CDP-glucose 4,6-dehydratase n=1 Tax=Roseimaritima multifibrata TaxID=1930274 RepID=A0A517MM59_9BACT|nr:CDP-glucose 4,6-dehydratase [Roseimaritima multifibrata]
MIRVTNSVHADFYRGRKVLVTGHTGFKGAWLVEWLLELGADVVGYALAPSTDPSLFAALRQADKIQHVVGDVRDASMFRQAVKEANPDVIFHLAAQPLVRQSYREPLETFAVNLMGTANLLDALRGWDRPCVVVVVTTDKCYENIETDAGYVETDRLGGRDPYSCSKAMAELAVDAFRQSYFSQTDHASPSPVRIATARAGNVIGGGDWAPDRIIPDCVRAVQADQPIRLRYPQSTRPWQHVLDPLDGYLSLARQLAEAKAGEVEDLATAFNFGPCRGSNRSVADVVGALQQQWPELQRVFDTPPEGWHEAGQLFLATDRAQQRLGWAGRWDFETTIRKTAEWYRGFADGREPGTLTREQITQYAAGTQESPSTST